MTASDSLLVSYGDDLWLLLVSMWNGEFLFVSLLHEEDLRFP